MFIIVYPRFVRSLFLVIAVVLFPILMFTLLTAHAVFECVREAEYQQRYGIEWKAHYEEEHEPLSKSRGRAVVAVHGGLAIACLGGWVIRQIGTAVGANSTSSRRRHSR